MPFSPSFSNTRFTNPWSSTTRNGNTPSAFTTRPARSPSACSTTSTNSFYSTTSSFGGLDAILAAGSSGKPTHTRNNSITSLSSNSSRRPSCFSIVEAEEERAEFGEEKIALLEPRNSVGWWGMRQILEEESVEGRL